MPDEPNTKDADRTTTEPFSGGDGLSLLVNALKKKRDNLLERAQHEHGSYGDDLACRADVIEDICEAISKIGS